MQYVYLAAVIMTALAAWTDHRTREIPNWLTFGGMGAGLLANCVAAFLLGGISEVGLAAGLSLLGGFINALPPLMIYRLNPMAIGGGDVKLLVAVGLFLGPVLGIEAEFYGFVVAAIYAPARVAYHGGLKASARNVVIVIKNSFRRPAKRVPLDESGVMEVRFAPALFAGTAVCIATAML